MNNATTLDALHSGPLTDRIEDNAGELIGRLQFVENQWEARRITPVGSIWLGRYHSYDQAIAAIRAHSGLITDPARHDLPIDPRD